MSEWKRTAREVARLINGANPMEASAKLGVNGWTIYQSGVESNNFTTTWVRSPGDTIKTRVAQGTVEVVEVALAKG